MYFPVKFEKPRKTVAFFKTPEKTLGLREKIPGRSLGRVEKPQI